MTTIKDHDTRCVYKLIGNQLFYTYFFNDGSVDEEHWREIKGDLSPYYIDIIEKLSSINQISKNMCKGIWDETLG